MTPEMTELARRAVACNGWRWMPGMMINTGFRCVWVDDETFRSFDQNGNETYGSTDCLSPDLTDPATLGCVLALVREKHNDPSAHVYWSALFRAWAVSFSCRGMGNYATEADALVAALEAKP